MKYTCPYNYKQTAYKYFSCSKPRGPQKLECSIITQVCDLCQPVHGWLVAALSTVMITLFHQEMSIDAFTIEV